MNIPNGFNRIVPKKCPICGTQRKNLSFEPVSNDKTKTAIYVACEECQTAIVFFISQNEMGVMTVGVLTDLNNEEAKSFFGAKPISANDILDLHDYLKNSSENIFFDKK